MTTTRLEFTAWMVGEHTAAYAALQKHAAHITTLSPVWMKLNEDGYTINKDPQHYNHETVRTIIAQFGIRCMPLISNVGKSFFESALVTRLVHNPDNRKRHIENLLTETERLGWDGINLDYEFLKTSDKDAYTRFVEECCTAFHQAGKRISIDVHAKTNETGWSASIAQDWKQLAAAVDEFHIMTYDFCGASSAPAPVAPLGWNDAVITYAKTMVPAEKLYMGMPAYGYRWDSGAKPIDCPLYEVEKYIHTYTPKILRPPMHDNYVNGDSPMIEFTDDNGKHNTIWFEDKQSWTKKIELAKKHGCRGISMWTIGLETEALWNTINQIC